MSAREAGLAALRSGDTEGAIGHLQEAVRAAAGDSQAWAGLGIALCQARRAQEGVQALERAISISPTQPSYHYNLGRGLEVLGKTPEALKAYRRTRELDPKHAQSATAVERLTGAGAPAPSPVAAVAPSPPPAAPPSFAAAPPLAAPVMNAAAPPPPAGLAPAAPTGITEFSFDAPPAPAAPVMAPAAAWGTPPPVAAAPWGAVPPPPPPPWQTPGYGPYAAPAQPYGVPPAVAYPPPPVRAEKVSDGKAGVWAAIGGVVTVLVLVGALFRFAGKVGLPAFGGSNLSTFKAGSVTTIPGQGVSMTLPAGIPAASPKNRSGTEVWETRGGFGEFAFTSVTLPSEAQSVQPAELFSRFQSGMLTAFKGSVTDTNSHTYRGYPAQELKFETNGMFKQYGRLRLIKGDDRIIVLAFVSRGKGDSEKPGVSGSFDSINIEKHNVAASPSPGGGGSGGPAAPSFSITSPPRYEPPTYTPPTYTPPPAPDIPPPSGFGGPRYGPGNPGGPPAPGFGGPPSGVVPGGPGGPGFGGGPGYGGAGAYPGGGPPF